MDSKPWQQMTPAGKFEVRAGHWQSPEGVQFASPDVEQAYRQRVGMLIDAIRLRKPARIPVCPQPGFYPFAYAGIPSRDGMYDYARLGCALKKYHTDFLPDARGSAALYGPGRSFEALDYKLYRWPGHGAPPTGSYQCVEAEYMQADEYDLLIRDPSGFFQRRYLPRIFGALEPWNTLPPLTDILELPFTGPGLIPFGLPPIQEAYKKLLEAGKAALEWIEACVAIDRDIAGTLGLPAVITGFTKAPFDTLGDTLRGTRAIMLDKFRQPKKVLAAMERLIPLAINQAVRGAKGPVVCIPLHKGADGFMSQKDFTTFYWPSLKAVILGLIEEGLIPYLFVEGGYNQRLDIIADPDIPAGSTIWMFDQTDLREVKKRFQGWACFGGNVPSSLLKAAKPEEVRDHVKRLIDDVGRDGGYILATGAVIDDAEPENLHALIDTGKEYGAGS
jgi:hypothetical protein